MSKTKDIREHFKKNPIECLCDWTPFLVTVISAIFIIAAVILFIRNGGYADKDANFNSISFLGLKFTQGTAGLLQGAAFSIIVMLLLTFETVVNVLKMIKKSGKLVGFIIRIYGIISLLVVIAGTLMNRILPEKVSSAIKTAASLDEKSAATWSWIITAVLILSWIAIFISADNAEGMAAILVGIFIAFFVSPALVLIIENAISIGIIILCLAIAGSLAFFGVRFWKSGRMAADKAAPFENAPESGEPETCASESGDPESCASEKTETYVSD